MAVLFTPFGRDLHYSQEILPELLDGSVMNTCTVSSWSPHVLEKELKMERTDIGFLHTLQLPGTPQHGHYVIGGRPTAELDLQPTKIHMNSAEVQVEGLYSTGR